MIRRYTVLAGLAVIVILILILIIKLFSFIFSGKEGVIKKAGSYKVNEKLLSVSENNRPGQKIEAVKGIVIHVSDKAGKNADSVWKKYSYFGETGETKESMHFLVDIDGTITQCIPTNEIAFHAGEYNKDHLGILYCYTSNEGKMTESGYKSMVALCAKLCKDNKLSASDVHMHYEMTGRNCPAYYVNNTESWQTFIKDVDAAMK